MSNPIVPIEQAVKAMTRGSLRPNDPVDNRIAAILIRAGVPIELVMDARRWSRKYAIISQRRWQSKISRRPPRGKHHDSWEIRERHVRGDVS